MLKKLSFLLDLSFRIYPYMLAYIILLDVSIFCYVFDFAPGYLKILLSDVNIFNLDFVIILFIIPLAIIVVFVLGIYFALSNRMGVIYARKCSLIKHYDYGIMTVFIVINLFITLTAVNVVYKVTEEIFLFYIIMVIGMSFHAIILRSFKHFERRYNRKYANTFLINLYILILISILTFFADSIYAIRIAFILVTFFISSIFTLFDKKDFQVSNKHNKQFKMRNLLLACTVIAIASFAFLQYNNKVTWNKEIKIDDLKIHNMTFNLLFNKGLLVRNNVPFEVKLSKLESQELIQNIDKLHINIGEDIFLADDRVVKVNEDFWYLDISGNKKMMMKNIYSSSIKPNKSIGYLILLIEERKYTNNPGSKHSLISYKLYISDKSLKINKE